MTNRIAVEGATVLAQSVLGPGWRVEEVDNPSSLNLKVRVSAMFFVEVPRRQLLDPRDVGEAADSIRAQVEAERDRLVKPPVDLAAAALALSQEAAHVVDMWTELGMAVPPKLAGAVAQWKASRPGTNIDDKR